jgi:hypothetical protein
VTQIKIKELGFTKADVVNKVWKYRYLSSSLDTELFERNTGNDYVIKLSTAERKNLESTWNV